MKKLSILLLILISGRLSYGKTEAPVRYHLLMDHSWKFILGDQPGAQQADFNDQNWRTLDLPHDWSIEGEFSKDAPTGGGGGYLPTGIGWYRKTFNLPAVARGKQVSIQFDGVYMNSTVWVNGHELGTRPNGYISFIYDLTPYLKPGKNTIAVRVDNSKQPNSRWYSGSGIYRHVWLNITNGVHIANWGTYVTTPQVTEGSALVTVKTTLLNSTGIKTATTEEIRITDENGNLVAEHTEPIAITQDSVVTNQQVTVKSPLLWSVETPHLYTLTTSIRTGKRLVDQTTQAFGIRRIEYNATDGFLLNGKRIKMNGVCLHHDGGLTGAAVPVKIWEQRLKNLKAMGCNAIRTSHNPPAPEFLDLCDRMGFLVMDEAFDVWETGKVKNDYQLYFDEWWRRDVTDQIHRDRNHPSVVLWSAGNEIPDQTKDRGIELLKGLLAVFHHEDPTRPVTTANDDIAADNGSTKLDFMNAEDIVGYNYVDRWHERRELFYDIDRHDHPDWKVIGTESESIRSVPDYSLGNDPAKVRANYNTGMIRAEQLWKFVAVHNYVIGDFMWTGIDYLGEARWPGRGASSGVIDMTNRPKDAYYFYQSQWIDKPVLHLFPHWNWAGREGQVIPVLAYTNCDTVELFVNGKSYGVKAREFPRQGNSKEWYKYDKPYVNITTADLHLQWDVVYEPGTIKAVGRKNGKEVIIDEIKTTGAPASLQIKIDTSRINTTGDNNVVTADVTVLDAAGNVVPTADNLVHFKVTGKGYLIGTDNGNQRDDHSLKLPQRNAFRGHAYAVVQSAGAAGEINITVEADGLKSASATVNVSRPQLTVPAVENFR